MNKLIDLEEASDLPEVRTWIILPASEGFIHVVADESKRGAERGGKHFLLASTRKQPGLAMALHSY